MYCTPNDRDLPAMFGVAHQSPPPLRPDYENNPSYDDANDEALASGYQGEQKRRTRKAGSS